MGPSGFGKSNIYRREDILSALQDVVGSKLGLFIVSFGPLAKNSDWHMVVKYQATKEKFLLPTMFSLSTGVTTMYLEYIWGVAIFDTEANLQRLRWCVDIYIMGGTFRMCPKPYCQFVPIHGNCICRVVPLAFCPLTGKTIEQ